MYFCMMEPEIPCSRRLPPTCDTPAAEPTGSESDFWKRFRLMQLIEPSDANNASQPGFAKDLKDLEAWLAGKTSVIESSVPT